MDRTTRRSRRYDSLTFNAKYLADVLNVLDAEYLHIELIEPLRPGVIRLTYDAEYLCVLMSRLPSHHS